MRPYDNPVPLPPGGTDVEFRVLICGVKLDETTRTFIDAAIRSAILQEVATIDEASPRRLLSPGDDPQTRSGLGLAREVLGLVLERGDVAR